jgi:hypothetical protein
MVGVRERAELLRWACFYVLVGSAFIIVSIRLKTENFCSCGEEIKRSRLAGVLIDR